MLTVRQLSAFLGSHLQTYSLRLRSCRSTGAFIISPLPPVLTKASCAVRSLRSTGITPLHRSYEPRRHRLVFPPLPGVAGYRRYLASADFSVGTSTASPVAQHTLVTVLPLPPRWSESTYRSGFVDPCCLRLTLEGSASRVKLCRGHLWVHLRCGPVTRSPSRRWLCQSASEHSVSLLSATQATGLLTPALAGLTPAGCASLRLDALVCQYSAQEKRRRFSWLWLSTGRRIDCGTVVPVRAARVHSGRERAGPRVLGPHRRRPARPSPGGDG